MNKCQLQHDKINKAPPFLYKYRDVFRNKK